MRSLEEINARNSAIARKYIEETPPRDRLERRLRAIADSMYPPDVIVQESLAGSLVKVPSARVRMDRETFVQRRLRAFDCLQTPEDREWFANLDDPGWTQFPQAPPAPVGGGVKQAV